MQLKRYLALVLVGNRPAARGGVCSAGRPNPEHRRNHAHQPGTETGGEQGDPLAGTRWRLVSLGAVETPTAGETEVTLEFDAAGRASGQGGCNSFGTATRWTAIRFRSSQWPPR